MGGSPSEPSKKTLTLPAFAHALIVSPWPSWLGYASPRRVGFHPVGRTEMFPSIMSIWQNYFKFPRTAHLHPAYKHDNQTRCGFGLVCTDRNVPFHWAPWIFQNFKQEFLLNGKRTKCLWRIAGPASRLTLPLQKGDWTRWVTLLAEPTFCELNSSPCFVKKWMKRCLF